MNNEYASAQTKLIKALIDLLENKDFLEITISEITMIAEVNRSTFYYYYNNTFELLEDSKQYMISTFLNSFSEEQRKRFESKDFEDNYIKVEYLLPYLKMIKKYKNIYVVYMKLKLKNDENFEKLLENIAIPVSKKKVNNNDKNKIRYVSNFYIAGIERIIQLWIENNFKESEEKICSIITELIKQ